MKTLLTILFFLIASTVISAQDSKKTAKDSTKTATVENVYICNGGHSTKYHKTDKCRGLSNCSTKIEKLAKDAAVKKGRTSCKICYK